MNPSCLQHQLTARWIRTKDDMTVQDLWPQSDPIRRQMLG